METTFFSLSYIMLWVFVIILSFVTIRMMHNQMENKNNSKQSLPFMDYGLKSGSKFPVTNMVSTKGEKIRVNSSFKGHVVIFTSIKCSVCKTIYPIISDYQKQHPDIQIIMMMLSDDTHAINGILLENNISIPIVQIAQVEQLDKFSTKRFPFAYSLSSDGTVVYKGVVNTIDHLNVLLDHLPSYKSAV